jgi:hypothetical protein
MKWLAQGPCKYQFSLFALCGLLQETEDLTPTPQMQFFRDPLEAHYGLRPQPYGHAHLGGIAFAQ